MKYFSTRNSNEKVSASWAISHGLAPDGGLYVPESLPMLSLDDIKNARQEGLPRQSAEHHEAVP